MHLSILKQQKDEFFDGLKIYNDRIILENNDMENKWVKRFLEFLAPLDVSILSSDLIINDPMLFMQEVYWDLDYMTYIEIGKKWQVIIDNIISTIDWHKIFEEYLLENNIYSQFCDGMFRIKYSYADYINNFYPPEYLNMYNIDHTYYIDWREKALNLINNV